MSNTFEVNWSHRHVGTENPSFVEDGHDDRDGVHEDLLRLLAYKYSLIEIDLLYQ